ncbi:MAG: putative atp-citrate synthase subunit 1 protein [Candidatus Saccharibacteria bacterium]|nr:putative atp-citrate synthase subunit 1 protein [Candidatus Saccharibacteria bacterium]
MIQIDELRAEKDMKIISLGSHSGIIQSMLDYDFLIGKQQPSIMAIVASGRKQERYFWGQSEVIIPVVSGLEKLTQQQQRACTGFINVQSARRVLSSSKQAFELLPNLKVGSIFAEQTPEFHTLEILKLAKQRNILIVGPSSVGILLPGRFKLGAIGGTQHAQISAANIISPGNCAVVSTSGGIVNELIHTVTSAGLGLSFGLALGGDRFPLTSPADALLLAEADPQTKRIVYFGELGGVDEYEIAKLIEQKKLTKELIVYIAGTVAELFETPPQFGHAKAFAATHDESASAKKDILREAGATVCETFADVASTLALYKNEMREVVSDTIGERHKSLIVSHISGDRHGETSLLGSDLLTTIERQSMASLVLSMLLGVQIDSQRAINFTDYVLRMLVDHGPYVSGAINTIVAARAGKDLVSSLAAGMLTIGPRFGGAINDAADNWLAGVQEEIAARTFTENFAKKGVAIPGIGHKKYRVDLPDPRVQALLQFAGNTNGDRYLMFARSVEHVTTAKKDILILNVDGAIAAIMLDILESELGYGQEQLKELVDIEFFNALFVLSRSIGFTAHYLDQRRHDEGLLRLSPETVRYIE